MSEVEKGEREADKARRRLGRLWVVLAAAVLLLGLLVWKAGLLSFGSIDEKLAAIDAELAIPDSENAAVSFRRLLTDPNNAGILDDLAALSPSAYVEPWTKDEHPELAAKLEKNRVFMQKLLDVFQMQKARFPVYPDPGDYSWQMLRDVRRVTFVLSWAAAGDLAEGRADAAIGKYRCQMQLARHLERQPGIYCRNIGIAIEAVALGNIKRAVMRDGTTPEQVKSLEAILEIPTGQDEIDTKMIARADRLIREKERSHMSTVLRLRQLLFGRKALTEQRRRQHLQNLRLEAIRRATPILIALRRYKDKTGTWPERLEDIDPKLAGDTHTDPRKDYRLVYGRDRDRFSFYIKGPYRVDEHGSYSGPGSVWPIWPLKTE